MKSRNGFVSNSSSSSFVIVGYKIDKIFSECSTTDKEAIIGKYAPDRLKTESFKKYGVEDVWMDFLYSTNFGVEGIIYLGDDDGSGYIGVVLADVKSEDSYLKNSETTIEDVMLKIKALQEAFGISDPPRIITGTRSC